MPTLIPVADRPILYRFYAARYGTEHGQLVEDLYRAVFETPTAWYVTQVESPTDQDTWRISRIIDHFNQHGRLPANIGAHLRRVGKNATRTHCHISRSRAWLSFVIRQRRRVVHLEQAMALTRGVIDHFEKMPDPTETGSGYLHDGVVGKFPLKTMASASALRFKLG